MKERSAFYDRVDLGVYNAMDTNNRSDIDHMASSLRRTGGFVYNNSHTLVLISIGWFLASVPIVTIGPATLAAYIAIDQLNSDVNRIEVSDILASVRQRLVPAFLLGLVPLVFFALSVLYLAAQAREPTLLRVSLFYLTLYLALYTSLVMIPTFRRLATGQPASKAMVAGVRWTATHPTLAMLTGIITATVLVFTLLLTIGFALLFPAIAFSFHTQLIPIEENRSDAMEHPPTG